MKNTKVKLNVSKKLKKELKEKGSKKLIKYLRYLQVNKLFKKEKHSNKVYKFLDKLDGKLKKELERFINGYTYSSSKNRQEKEEVESYSSCGGGYSSCG